MSRSINAIIKVAVGIVIDPQHRVLVALRPAHNPHGGLWEFPGGKFEPDESPLQALSRELNEEIGIELISATPLICIQHDYGHIKVELDTWRIAEFNGTPYGREGQQIDWVDHQQLQQLKFPAGNRKIVSAVAEALQAGVA